MNIHDIINGQDGSQKLEGNISTLTLFNYPSIQTCEDDDTNQYNSLPLPDILLETARDSPLYEERDDFGLQDEDYEQEQEEAYQEQQMYTQHHRQLYSVFSTNFGYFSTFSSPFNPYAEKQRIQKLACAKLLSKQRQTLYYFLINRNIYMRVAETI